MNRSKAMSLAAKWAEGGACTLREDEAREYHKICLEALRAQQQPNDWICTLKCKALMDGGICEHGGLCCLYESQRAIEENAPLTLDELRHMDGEPVWVHFIGGAIIREDGWFVIAEIGTSEILIKGKVSVYKSLWYYGETWLAYRRKLEEVTT